MCLEDLRLGKGRTPDKTVSVTVSTNNVLGPDANRVAILVSINAISASEPVGPTYTLDAVNIIPGPSIGGTPIITANTTVTPFVLRVEDLGQLIMQAFSVSITNNSTSVVVNLTPIKSYVDAPAIISGKP